MATTMNVVTGRAASFQTSAVSRSQTVSTDFVGLPLRTSKLLSTRWSPLNGKKRSAPVARYQEAVSARDVEVEAAPARIPETVASVEVPLPLAYINNSQQYLPAMLVGALITAAFYALFGKKQQAPAPAYAGGNNGAFQAVAPPPQAPAAPAAAPQPIVIQMTMPPVSGGQASSQSQDTKGTPKDATRKARDAMAKYFPVVQKDVDFLGRVAETLEELGFNRNNSIALVDACRDEITRGLVQNIDEIYGESFNISGLGGYVNCGKTGLKAGMAHSPTLPDRDQNGKIREKYVFFAFPHVAVSADGAEGMVQRIGREKISSACGALLAIQGEAGGYNGETEYDDDAEYTILRNKVLFKQSCQCDMRNQKPNLMEITKTALDVITEDLNDLLSKVINPETADFAVVTGIQIHAGTDEAPDGVNQFVDYVAPGTMYAVVNGQGYSLDWRWENGRVVSKKMSPSQESPAPRELVGARN